MNKLFLLLVLMFVATGMCRLPPPCESGVWGPWCSHKKPCKPGYTCIGRKCCLDLVCPPGTTPGPKCNTHPGKPKCGPGYECINGLCCSFPHY